MQQSPQRIVVYQSQGQAMADEFWWSPGWFTPTKAGDFILIVALLAIAIVAWLRSRPRGYNKPTKWQLVLLVLTSLVSALLSLPLIYHLAD